MCYCAHKHNYIISLFDACLSLCQGHFHIAYPRPNLISSAMMVKSDKWQGSHYTEGSYHQTCGRHPNSLRDYSPARLSEHSAARPRCTIWASQCDSCIFNGNVGRKQENVRSKLIAVISPREFFKPLSPTNTDVSIISEEKKTLQRRDVHDTFLPNYHFTEEKLLF